ncbi:hypothetical protein ALNOE001_21010 [Candidatus Methanobinarius endosymbioticus]|uniref:B box-type domain-containing protein n=1 Tax=Candidatus Methanobinarius endosymbioticus TaxID=2006182 RepID=A0A366M7Z7_9EURY|nr:hypothetical protein ALNOE001_21010 [Candidatus Methanobinarius endosymbioticus]
MSCQNQPNKESISTCQFCGKEFCEECSINIAGKTYCEECMIELVGPELVSIASNKNLNETVPPNQQQNSVYEVISQETASNIIKQTPQENEVIETETIPIKDDIAPKKEALNNIKKDNLIRDETPTNSQENFNNNHDDIYSDDRLYNDINEETKPITNETNTPNSNSRIEEKYEKYLDDLYFDEEVPNVKETSNNKESMTTLPEGLSLSEQLAMDEAAHGSITKEPYVTEVEEETEITTRNPREFENEDDNRNRSVPIMKNLRNESGPEKENVKEEDDIDKYGHSALHRQNIHYKKKEDTENKSTERVLTILLVVLIILVAIYLIYIFTLSGDYTSFLDALGAFFSDPGKVLGQIAS